MSGSAVVLAALTPGFKRFLIVVALLIVFAIALGIIGALAKPHIARRARTINGYLLLTLLALVILFPVYITVVNSLLRPDVIGHRPPTLFPTHPQWSVYSTAWSDGHLSRY